MTIRNIRIQIKPNKPCFLMGFLAFATFGTKGLIGYLLITVAISFLQTLIVPSWKNAFFSPKP